MLLKPFAAEVQYVSRLSSLVGLVFLAAALNGQTYMSVQRMTQAGGPANNGPNAFVDLMFNEYSGISRSGDAAAIINGTTAPDYRAYGRFLNGNVTPGTALPSVNQNGGSATYSGGIGFTQGVCLCTGFADDNDLSPTTDAGLGKGVQGPNNGQPFAGADPPTPEDPGSPGRGEVDYDFSKPADTDALQALGISGVTTGDAAVLDTVATFTSPGILIVRYVVASDEFPKFPLETYNDTPTVLWRNSQSPDYYKTYLFSARIMVWAE